MGLFCVGDVNRSTRLLALASAACNRYPQATTTVVMNGFYPEYRNSFGISVSGKGGIRLRRGKNLLPRLDGPLTSSELGEYPTYIIRLSRRY